MKPLVITRHTLAAGAARLWRQQRGAYIASGHRLPTGRTDAEIAYALDALGPSPDPDEVDRTIGNDWWTRVPPCNGCGERVDAVVRVGEEPDHESATAYLCVACAREALAALGEGA